MGTRKLLNCKATIKWIKQYSKKASWLTSVCTGSLLLAKAGLLKNRKATTHWGALDLLKEISPSTKVIKNKRVVNDGIITAAGVSSGIDMAFNLVEILYGKNVVSDTAKYIEYNRSKIYLPHNVIQNIQMNFNSIWRESNKWSYSGVINSDNYNNITYNYI